MYFWATDMTKIWEYDNPGSWNIYVPPQSWSHRYLYLFLVGVPPIPYKIKDQPILHANISIIHISTIWYTTSFVRWIDIITNVSTIITISILKYIITVSLTTASVTLYKHLMFLYHTCLWFHKWRQLLEYHKHFFLH